MEGWVLGEDVRGDDESVTKRLEMWMEWAQR